jgi:hypothetical protein
MWQLKNDWTGRLRRRLAPDFGAASGLCRSLARKVEQLSQKMGAKDYSFDVVSRIDMQELRNAVLMAQKELANRFDFKNSVSEIQQEEDGITLISDDEFKLQQLRDILEGKLIKREVDLRLIEYAKPEKGSKGTVKQKVRYKQGISADAGRALVKRIKEAGLKVQAQMQGDELRVFGKDKDELQKAIQFIKKLELDFPVDFLNYR